ISRFVGHLMATFEQKVMSRTDTALDETALPMVNRFVRFLVVAIGVLLALPQLGISIAPLLGGAGVMGLALSFAAKDTLSNLIAGVLLIMDRPFKVGDRIELWNAPRETGTWGDVIEIGLRATKIRNPDNLVVVVPNNEIMRRDIINYTMSGDDIRLRIPFSCAYESDIERAKVLLKEVAHEVKGVKLDPAPIVIVRGFGPSEVNLQLRVWIVEARSRRRIADEITEKAMVAFAGAGVEIPYPKRELYIRGGGAAGLLPSGE
ncbi:MAG: mechanosensitive ion channel family protein, partial [Gemmatimonadota bacterium]|nr:mechanosensitive ion channel family protein [Gemmatimonadota bacterium]